jgi:hypothetical protein
MLLPSLTPLWLVVLPPALLSIVVLLLQQCFPPLWPFTLSIVATLLRGSVRMKLTLLNLGLGSPLGLPKLQSSIARVKTPRIKVFFISLESY